MDSDARPQRKTARLQNANYADARAYHLTTITRERAPIFLEPRFARATLNVMYDHRKQFEYAIYAFVLMPDHWHVLLNPLESKRSVSELLGGLKSLSTRALWALGWEGKVWQERFHDHILRDLENVTETISYILENPVRGGLVQSDQPYPYCGIIDQM
jgi:putative transposase